MSNLFDNYQYSNSNSIPAMDTYYTPSSSRTTLWMGDLDHWMDENFLQQVWRSYGEHVVVKLIRDKRTNASCGYAFVGFSSSQAAQKALANFHGTKIPNSQKVFRLNWASGGGICDRKEDRAPEYSLFAGDLSNDIDETFLLSLFRNRYPSCHSAKIMTDPITGLSRGYGFVRFLDQLEQQEAVLEMNGILCDNRPLRVSFATPKSTPIQPINNALYHSPPENARYLQLALQAPALVHQPTDPNNTTVFVGGLSSPVTEEELGHYFAPFGDVTYVKIPPGKGCGFVQYVTRSSAEQAIERMNGFLIGTSRIRLSWGRSQADKLTTATATTTIAQQELTSPSTFSSTTSSSHSMHLLGSFRPLSPPSSFSQKDIFSSATAKNELDDDWLLMPNTTTITNNTAALMMTAEEQSQFLGENHQQHVNNTQWHQDMNDILF